MPSVLAWPLASAVAMLSCCSMMAAPMAANVITMAMICRWREPRSRASASPPLTPSSSPVLAASLVPARSLLRTMQTTISKQTARIAALTSSIVVVPSSVDQRGGDRRAGGTAQAGAAADQPEQALGLPGVVDVVGQGPELADQQDAEDQPVEVEAHRHPLGAEPGEQHPEGDQQHDHAGLRHRNGPPARHAGDRLGVALHQHADDHPGGELHPRQVVGAEAGDELRPRDRLDDVVGRHRQERVEEHQQRGAAFAGPDFGDGGQPAGQHRRTGRERRA